MSWARIPAGTMDIPQSPIETDQTAAVVDRQRQQVSVRACFSHSILPATAWLATLPARL